VIAPGAVVYRDAATRVAAPAPPGVRIGDLAADAAGGVSPPGLAAGELPALVVYGGRGEIQLLALRVDADEVAQLVAGEGLPSGHLVIYATATCSDCRLAKRLLSEAGIPFVEVDLERDPESARTVARRSGGREVTPTLVWDDRVWLFNPGAVRLRRMLAPRPERPREPS
jgi:mycoredoxin